MRRLDGTSRDSGTSRPPSRSDRTESTERREEFNRRLLRIAEEREGPIKPSEWQEHRQDLIDARRGTTGRTIDRDREPTGDRFDGPRPVPEYARNYPESFEPRPRSPIGPTEIGRGYLFQYDTRTHRYHEDNGHYFYRDRWHDYPEDHRHYEGCGHFFFDNTWHRWPREHRHHARCGHHYYDGDWYDFPRGHRHGPHCGHDFHDGVWHRFPRTHRHGPNCGHFYYNGYWYWWPQTHRHYPGCGHFYFNFYWYPFPAAYYGYEETVVIVPSGAVVTTSYADGDLESDHAARAYDKAQRGDYYGAIAAFSTAIAATEDQGPLYLAQGLMYMQVGDYRSAYRRILEGLRRTPDLSMGHPDLQGLIPDPEEIEWRILDLMDAIEIDPANDKAILTLGYLQFLKGDYEGAMAALKAVVALDPANEQAARLLEFIGRIDGGT